MFSHDPFRIEFHHAYMKKRTSIIITVDQKFGLRSAFAKKTDSLCVVLTSNQKLQDIERDS